MSTPQEQLATAINAELNAASLPAPTPAPEIAAVPLSTPAPPPTEPEAPSSVKTSLEGLELHPEGPPPDHPRFTEVYAKMKAYERQVEAMNKHGISPETLGNVIQRAQIQYALEQRMANDPEGFIADYQRAFPEAYGRVVNSLISRLHPSPAPSITPTTKDPFEELLGELEGQKPSPAPVTAPPSTDPELLQKISKLERFANTIAQREQTMNENAILSDREEKFNATVGDLCTTIGLKDAPENSFARDSLVALTAQAVANNRFLENQVIRVGDMSVIPEVFKNVATKYFKSTAQSQAAPAPALKPLAAASSVTPAIIPVEKSTSYKTGFNADEAMAETTRAIQDILKEAAQ